MFKVVKNKFVFFGSWLKLVGLLIFLGNILACDGYSQTKPKTEPSPTPATTQEIKR